MLPNLQCPPSATDLWRVRLQETSGGARVDDTAIHLSTWGVVVQGSCIQIMAVPPAVYKGAAAATPGRPFPPMLFVHMARDGATAAVAAQDVAALTAEVRQLYNHVLETVYIPFWPKDRE